MAFVSPSRTATWPSSSGGLADVYVNALYLQIDLGRTLSSGKSGDTLLYRVFSLIQEIENVTEVLRDAVTGIIRTVRSLINSVGKGI